MEKETLEWLAKSFEENRKHLRSVAFRILGTTHEADDAVQEAWLRLSRTESAAIENLGGWLTTVVSRVCLDALRSRKVRKEESLDTMALAETSLHHHGDSLIADTVGPALLYILNSLSPGERVAFVLHDLFDLSFEEIALIVDRSVEAARQLASRARRKVRGQRVTSDTDSPRQGEVVSAFLAACREGNFDALLSLLDPHIVLRADAVAVKVAKANADRGAPALAPEIRDPKVIAETFKGKAVGAKIAWIDGFEGGTWVQGDKPRAVFAFAIQNGLITEIDVIMDPVQLGKINVQLMNP